MSRAARDAELRLHGTGLVARFALSMTAALLLVMTIAGYVLFRSSTNIAQNVMDDSIARAVTLMSSSGEIPSMKTLIEQLEGSWALEEDDDLRALVEQLGETAREIERLQIYRVPPLEQVDERAMEVAGVQIFDVRYGEGAGSAGKLYQVKKENDKKPTQVVVPAPRRTTGRSMLRLILGLLLVVVLVGAGVAMWVARQISLPIHDLVDDVRQISKGNLQHRIRARGGGGELELLARSISRMTRDLEAAQEAELELSIRNREVELAAGVRESLLPVATPIVPGYDLGGAQIASDQIGGDLFDYVDYADGRIGVLVCDVSGQGLPAALIGAAARSYLRSELRFRPDLADALRYVNRELAQDVRRGMFVTALYALLDPRTNRVEVACAGHKLPLLRYTAADKKLRLVHPEGIALGFDKGPVFDRSLHIQELAMEPGDRLVLANTAPAKLLDATEEDGEKAFYSLVLRHAGLPTTKFLKGLRRALEESCGEEGFPADVSLVTLTRDGGAREA